MFGSCRFTEEEGGLIGWPYWNVSGLGIKGDGVELYEGDLPTDLAGEWLELGLQFW